jgi:hypothetical protein
LAIVTALAVVARAQVQPVTIAIELIHRSASMGSSMIAHGGPPHGPQTLSTLKVPQSLSRAFARVQRCSGTISICMLERN